MIPPLGPLSVLCVVEVLIKANSLGETSQRLIKMITWEDVDMTSQN